MQVGTIPSCTYSFLVPYYANNESHILDKIMQDENTNNVKWNDITQTLTYLHEHVCNIWLQAAGDGAKGSEHAASGAKALSFNGSQAATLALLTICWEHNAQRPGYSVDGTIATGQHPLIGCAGNASSALRVRIPNLLPRTTSA